MTQLNNLDDELNDLDLSQIDADSDKLAGIVSMKPLNSRLFHGDAYFYCKRDSQDTINRIDIVMSKLIEMLKEREDEAFKTGD